MFQNCTCIQYTQVIWSGDKKNNKNKMSTESTDASALLAGPNENNKVERPKLKGK